MPKDKLWNELEWPGHMRPDVRTRNENITQKRKLCDRCQGTGNELMSMYHKCTKCNGNGYIEKKK